MFSAFAKQVLAFDALPARQYGRIVDHRNRAGPPILGFDASHPDKLLPSGDGFAIVDRVTRADRAHPMIARNGELVEPRLRQCSLYNPTLDLAVEDAPAHRRRPHPPPSERPSRSTMSPISPWHRATSMPSSSSSRSGVTSPREHVSPDRRRPSGSAHRQRRLTGSRAAPATMSS